MPAMPPPDIASSSSVESVITVTPTALLNFAKFKDPKPVAGSQPEVA